MKREKAEGRREKGETRSLRTELKPDTLFPFGLLSSPFFLFPFPFSLFSGRHG